MKTKLLLFDIDGTLLLTGGCGKIALERAFLDIFKVPHAWNNIVPDGKTDPLIMDEMALHSLHRNLTLHEHEKIKRRYEEYFLEEISSPMRFRLMPGVGKLLRLLQAQSHCLLGIATGNFEVTSWAKLKFAGLDSFF